MISNPSDPIKEPKFQKVIRHFVTTAPKTHDEMRAEKHELGSASSSRQKRREKTKGKPE
jgi:hypothetical protein